MVLLLGATGYIGQAFARELRRRQKRFVPLTRAVFDYTRFNHLFDYIRRLKPSFLVNAAGFAGKPSVDDCERARAETFQANVILPQTIARACRLTNTPWGHVSTGCIYSGAKIREKGSLRVEKNLNKPEVRKLLAVSPEKIIGFNETDEPNFSFRHSHSNFCSGTKALAEEAIRDEPQIYIWRPRVPFNESDEPRNLLSKIQSYEKVYDTLHSLSHLDECVSACLDLWEKRAPFGIYNMTNPGVVSTREIVEMIARILKPSRPFSFWQNDKEFYAAGHRARRSNCILDTSKIQAAGIKLRDVHSALESSLRRWRPAGFTPTLFVPPEHPACLPDMTAEQAREIAFESEGFLTAC